MTPEQPNLSVEQADAEIARLHALNESEAEFACALACMFDDPKGDARIRTCVHLWGVGEDWHPCIGGPYTHRQFDDPGGVRHWAACLEAIGPPPCPTLIDFEIRRRGERAACVGEE